MSSIDERVVQMRFENQQFERGAKESLGTLDKLKNALTFGKASKNLEELQNQSNRFNMNGIGNALSTVTVSFSNFELMGLRVLNNIADSAYRTGTRLIKSLSVDNIAAGWKKFEDKTTSVATLISQGYDMSTVDEQLERLNWFTDETSYNFTDMVSNISKFTATGKGLEESVNAMEGIATWASLSGQNASTASRAMYQLSQAMSAGVMRREDYKSIQNMSMDTQEFRQHALDAGVALGTLKKNADGTYKSIVKGVGKVESFNINQFANHLTEDMWFTDKVMMKVFGDYGAAIDQIYDYTKENGGTASDAIEALGKNVDAFGLKAFKSAQEARTFTDVLDSVKDAVSTGWMQTFEYIFGNYEEAKALWTDLANALYDAFAGGAEIRNGILDDWKEMGGRVALIEAFWSAWNGVANIISMVKEAWAEMVFDIQDTELPTHLWEISESIAAVAKKFENLFKLPDNYKDIMKYGTDYSKGIVSTIATRIQNLNKTLRGVFALVDIAKKGIGTLVQLGSRLLKSLLPVGDSILGITGSFGDWAINLRDTINETQFFENIVETLGPIIDKTGSIIIWVLDKLKDGFSKVKGIFKPFNEEVEETGDVVEKKWSPIGAIVDIVRKAFERLGQIFGALGPVLSKIGEALSTVWDKLHTSIMDKLTNFGSAGGMDIVNGGLFGILILALNNMINKVKEAVPSGDILKSLTSTVTDSVKSIVDALTNLVPKGDDSKDSIMDIAIAIGILAGSLFLISTIDTSKLVSSVAAIGALMYMLENIMERLSKINSSSSMASSQGGGFFGKIFGLFSSKYSSSSDLAKTSAGMIMIAGAVGLLAISVGALAKLDWGQLGVGLTGVAALLVMLVAVAKALSSMEGKLVKGAGSLILVAIAVRVLASSVAKLGEMDVDKMVNGIMAVGALLLELGVFTKIADKFSIGSGLGLVALAGALVIIAQAVKSFGNLDINVLSQGMSSIAAIMAGLIIFTRLVNTDGILKTGVAMVIMGAALKIIGSAIKSVGAIDPKQLSEGMNALAKSLAALAIVAIALAANQGTLGASFALLTMSAALLVLAGAFKVMASIPATSITKVLLAFAGTLVVLGVAAAILAPLTMGILALSAAMVAIGVGILAAGMGLTALSAGIMAVGASLVVAGPMLVNAITATLTAMLISCNTLIPLFVNVGLNIILNLLTGIYNKLPAIATMAVLIILKFLLTISQLMPLIVMVGMQLIINFINGMALAVRDNSEAIVMAVGNLMSSIVYLVMTAFQKIAEQIPIIGGWVSDGIQGIKDSIDSTFNEEDMAAIAEKGMSGAARGIEAAEADVSEASSGLSNTGIDGFLENMPAFNTAGSDFSLEGIEGLLSNEQGYTDAGNTLGLDAISGADSADLLKNFFGIGEDGGTGMVNGLYSKEDDVETAAYNVGKAAVRGGRRGMQEKSPSKAFHQIGEYGDQGLINGLLSMRTQVGDTAEYVGETAVNSLGKILGNIGSLISADFDKDIQPVIRPVLDLSNIQNGTNAINGMFGNTSFALASANGSAFEANRLAALTKLEATTTNADVVAALGLLRGDVNNLNDSFLGTQVVLDSGALVGATARQMDNALGRIKVYKGRGI